MHKVAIIGSGPAGMAAALQLQRYAIDFIWFGKGSASSPLKHAYCVENYLGFPAAKGSDLLNCYRNHLKQYDLESPIVEAKSVDYLPKKKCFAIQTDTGNYLVEKVIIASGTKPKLHHLIENLSEDLKLKVGYNVDPFVDQLKNSDDKVIAIIGAGDVAFNYALSVASYNNFAHIFARSAPKAIPPLINKAENNEKIFYHPNTNLVAINKGGSDLLKLEFTEDLTKKDICVNYLIVAIGRDPQKDFYSENLLKKEAALIGEGSLFLAGDVKNDGIYRQTALAIADGIAAAMTIINSSSG
jgi:thioredoxin reductase